MLSSEVKELINLLKTKTSYEVAHYEEHKASGEKVGIKVFFEDQNEDHHFYGYLIYLPNDPKEVQQQKEEE